jgi:flagellar protein FlgJ
MESYDFVKLGEMRAKAAQQGPAQAGKGLRQAAEQFEALFLNIMMKTMREATASNEEGDLFGSSSVKTYESLFDQEIAQQMAKRGGLGLADMMVKSWERNNGAASAASAEALSTEPAAHSLAQRALTKGLRGGPPMPLQTDQARPMPAPRDPKVKGLVR